MELTPPRVSNRLEICQFNFPRLGLSFDTTRVQIRGYLSNVTAPSTVHGTKS